ncbi:MAG: hypothetical protein LBF37_02160 [Rickettsiales bacterium]|nr:hypothetical protein [Rickettsiales bacterium]
MNNKIVLFARRKAALWTLVVLSLGGARAQNTAPGDATTVNSSILLSNNGAQNIAAGDTALTQSAPLVPQNYDFESLFAFISDNYRDYKLIVYTLEKIDFVTCIYESNNNSDDSFMPVAYYNPLRNNITVRYFITPNFEQSVHNSRLPFAFIHELKHRTDIGSFSKFMFNARQQITSNIHEECTARCMELILVRNIARKTGYFAAAFQLLVGEDISSYSRMPEMNRPNPYNEYKKWLAKNLPHLDQEISGEEADVLLKTVMSMLDVDLLRRYQSALCPIIKAAAVAASRDYQKIMRGVNHKSVLLYENYISKIWTFQAVNLLDICSDKTRKKFIKFCDEFYTSAIRWPAINKIATQYDNQMSVFQNHTFFQKEKEKMKCFFKLVFCMFAFFGLLSKNSSAASAKYYCNYVLQPIGQNCPSGYSFINEMAGGSSSCYSSWAASHCGVADTTDVCVCVLNTDNAACPEGCSTGGGVHPAVCESVL